MASQIITSVQWPAFKVTNPQQNDHSPKALQVVICLNQGFKMVILYSMWLVSQMILHLSCKVSIFVVFKDIHIKSQIKMYSGEGSTKIKGNLYSRFEAGKHTFIRTRTYISIAPHQKSVFIIKFI